MTRFKAILAIILTLNVFSCALSKKTTETDKSVASTRTERVMTTRPGDTLTIDIPNIRYKDTVITTVNYENKTIARVRYDDQGNQQFDCIQGEMRELREVITSLVENNITSDSETESKFTPQHFIYSIIGLGVVVMLMFWFFNYKMSRMNKNFGSFVSHVNKTIEK